MEQELITITRSGQSLILPKDIYDLIYNSGRYISLNKHKTTSRIYYQAIVGDKKGKKLKRIPLARLILNAPPFKHVDHIDGNPLNNCRTNLRLATRSENGCNRKKQAGTFSKYKGVYLKKGKWRCVCIKDKVIYSAGPFNSEIDAAIGYNTLAKAVHGDFALLNQIDC